MIVRTAALVGAIALMLVVSACSGGNDKPGATATPTAAATAPLPTPPPQGPIVLGKGRYGGMDWSTDSRSVVFALDGVPYTAEVPDFTSRELFPLLSLATPLVQPRWSPDGSRIAFVGSHPGRGGNPNDSSATIWIANRDGSGLRDLLPGTAADLAPTNSKELDAWLDNETVVFYQGCGTACRHPYLLQVDSGQIDRAVGFPDTTTGELGVGILGTTYYWSPDKHWIAADDAAGRKEILMYDRESQALTRLTPPPPGFNETDFLGLWQMFDAWASDSGSFLYEQSENTGGDGPSAPPSLHLYDLYSISAREDRVIATAGKGAVWSPDGTQIAYVAPEFPDKPCGGAGDATTCIAVIDATTGKEQFRAGPANYRLDAQNSPGIGPLLLPGGRVIYTHPSGNVRLADEAGDVILASPQGLADMQLSGDARFLVVAEPGLSGRVMVVAIPRP